MVSNDNFANAIVVTGTTYTASSTNVEATGEAEEPGGGSSESVNSLWWSWTVPVAGNVTINTSGSSFDTILDVYTGTALDNLTFIAGDDDSSSSLASSVSFATTAGTTYQIAVDGYGTETGTIVLNFFYDNFPTVINITSPIDGTYGIGQIIPITVQYSEPVTVTGIPQLTLNLGAIANYTSGSGSDTLTFNYTVAAGNNSSDLDYQSTLALTLNGGTIKNAAMNDAIRTLPEPATANSLSANRDLVIDTVAPTVTINQAPEQTDPTATSPINFTVTFSETVTGFDVNDIDLTTSTATGSLTPKITGSGPVYNVEVNGITGGGNVIASIKANSVTDTAGNNNTASTSTDNTVSYDTVVPTPTPSVTPTPTPTPTPITNNIPNDDCICDKIPYPSFNQPIAGNDNLYGGNSNDIFNGNSGNDFILGGNGDDTLYGDEDNDLILGELGKDLIFGGKGSDSLNGKEGDDVIFGNKDDDFIDGDNNNDTLFGGKGNDTILGSEGNDNLFGQLGSDTLCGGEGNDLISGDEQSDMLAGCGGNDSIYGGEDSDTLMGGKGDDLLYGNLGFDSLTGGSGKDIFALKLGEGFDTIGDFNLGEDLIGLTGGLSFDLLEMIQGDRGTIIKNILTGEQLVIIIGTSDRAINAASFVSI
ncbi:hypothetical protein BCD67_23300 [Oscillatoriales cyanobacterium USR001]|nr:hypothetical protein BCD67_23300 [Oscillatoriales cyanobacterium USR001]